MGNQAENKIKVAESFPMKLPDKKPAFCNNCQASLSSGANHTFHTV